MPDIQLDFGGVADENEEDPGGFLCLNDDDDNGDGIPDKDETAPTTGEDDLVPLTITADGTLEGTLTLTAESGATRIKLYDNPDRSSPVTLPMSWELGGLPKTFYVTLYVEGVNTSLALADVELLLAFDGPGGICEDIVKLTVFTATLDAAPSTIPATTAWPSMPDYSFSELTVEWTPAAVPGILEIAEVVTNGYTPPSDGTLQQVNGTEWRYDAFDEPQTELHSKTVDVWIAATVDGKEAERVRIRVLPVHNWWTTPHQHGPDGTFHAPDVADYTNDYNFIRWKYGVVLATTGGAFSSVEISANPCVSCLLGPCVTACVNIFDEVKFSANTFGGSENKAASVIGHELLHASATFPFLASECDAYTWEVDHQMQTGIDQDAPYLQEVLQNQASECN